MNDTDPAPATAPATKTQAEANAAMAAWVTAVTDVVLNGTGDAEQRERLIATRDALLAFAA